MRPAMADVSLGSLLPLRKFWAAQNVASGEEGAILHPGKVQPHSTNPHSKFGTARPKFVDAWVC